MCIMRIQAVQKGVRAYCNLYGYQPGDNVPGLKSQVIGPGKFVEAVPLCPGHGEYIFLDDKVPETGELYMKCSIPDHVPADHSQW
jgi:hypothetical protein